MHEDKSSIGDNNSLKIGIIHLITEGVQLFVGGVGSYIRGQIMALPEVIKLLADNNISLEPHFIEIASSKYNYFFDTSNYGYFINQIHNMGGPFQLYQT